MAKQKFRRTNVEIDEVHMKRFREIFPQSGSLKWFLNGVFEEFFARYDYDSKQDIRESVDAALSRMDEE